MKESAIVARIIKHFRSEGFFIYKNHGNQYAVKGLPDLTMVWHGRAVYIEVKVPGKKPTKIQEHCLHKIRASGGIAFCAHSLEEVIELLTDLA